VNRLGPLALSVLLGALPSCAIVEYTDLLVDDRSRTPFVTQPASVGGIVGFTLGIPLDLVALPVTYVVYATQKDQEEEGVDPLSTLFFPSFVLWRAGVVTIGAPLDLLEFIFYRTWRDPPARTRPEYDRDEVRKARQERG
jgi:hypothetical protein